MTSKVSKQKLHCNSSSSFYSDITQIILLKVTFGLYKVNWLQETDGVDKFISF